MPDALEVLQREQPRFHGGGDQQWAISPAVLEFLGEQAKDRVTLETGSGYSTVVMGTVAKRHIAVSPDDNERVTIEAFCREHELDISALDFRADVSETVLPGLDVDALDLVLIDGSHSFPLPYLDWYFTADLLREGGLMLVDDVQLRPPRLLRTFLMNQPEWGHVVDIDKTTVFRKLVDGPVRAQLGGHQPWSLPQYALPGDGVLTRLRKLRGTAYVHWKVREFTRNRHRTARDGSA